MQLPSLRYCTINFRANQEEKSKILTKCRPAKTYKKYTHALGIRIGKPFVQNDTKQCVILQKCIILQHSRCIFNSGTPSTILHRVPAVHLDLQKKSLLSTLADL